MNATTVTTATPAPLDLPFDLDALLADSLAAKAEAAKGKAIRKTLATTQLNSAERAELSEKLALWETKREWTPKANVLVLATQQCLSCGSLHTHIVGTFQRQSHRHSKIDRWIKPEVSASSNDLPKETKEEVTQVAMCFDCKEQFGW